ncbi:MAG: hypothetical protein J6Y02_11055 [Pseudobutyrivibrio sp.]|nr:hypothetical protein [Pseudobutyrivibrio sp.]
MIWEVKTTEPTTTIDSATGGLKITGYNTLEIECDDVDVKDGVMIFYNLEILNSVLGTQKMSVLAMFPIRNLVSVIKEESNEQTSETTVQ